MPYPLEHTPTIFVDHDSLREFQLVMNEPGIKAALVGYGEYSKHLVNWYPDKVIAIYDENPLYQNIRFRGVPVVGLDQHFDVNLIVGCEYSAIYDLMGRVVKQYNYMRRFVPHRLHYKNTSDLAVFEQEDVYKAILKNENDAPVSMMNGDKIRFLLELCRAGLSCGSGNILEMGSWQGGSAWFMGKLLRYQGEQRKLYMVDLFETHMMDPTATMCTDEIRSRMAAVYDHVEMKIGLVDDPTVLAEIEGPFAFVHIDLGNQEPGLRFAWDALLPGAPLLLDNYGHLAATLAF